MKIVDNELKKLIYITDETLLVIIDGECLKPADDMDIDLIEICLDIIISRKEAKTGKREAPKRYSTKKVVRNMILTATIVALLAASIAMTFAELPFIKDGLQNASVDTVDNSYVLDTENLDTTPDGYALTETDFATIFKNGGYEPLTFPEMLVGCDITDINVPEVQPGVMTQNASVKFKIGKIIGSFMLVKSDRLFNGKVVLDEAVGAKELNVNGLDIVIYYTNKHQTIQYYDSHTNMAYTISLKCSREEAIAMAETIK